MRVWPPTSTTSLILLASTPASFMHCLQGSTDRCSNILHHRFQFGTGQLLDQVLGPDRVRCDERQIDLGFLSVRELDLGALRRVTQTLQMPFRCPCCQIETLVLLEFLDQPIDDALVDVVTAQVRVAVGGLHFDDAFADFQDGNVERAAAEIVHRDGFVLLLSRP